MTLSPVAQARLALASLLVAMQRAEGNDREEIAALVNKYLVPGGDKTVTELAEAALEESR